MAENKSSRVENFRTHLFRSGSISAENRSDTLIFTPEFIRDPPTHLDVSAGLQTKSILELLVDISPRRHAPDADFRLDLRGNFASRTCLPTSRRPRTTSDYTPVASVFESPSNVVVREGLIDDRHRLHDTCGLKEGIVSFVII